MTTATMTQLQPGKYGFPVPFKKRYCNYVNGMLVTPVSGEYFDNVSPVTGEVYCEVARSNAADVDRALDAAHAAKKAWGKTSAAHRARILEQIAQRIDDNLELLATAETWDNGKPIRETMNADIPLCSDHFRYFAGCIRAQEGGISEIDQDTVAYHYHEPLGVVAQIIPWNFPLLMACWKLAPALAAGNCVVLKPAEQTPVSIMILMELIGDLLPAGVLNIVNGFAWRRASRWHQVRASTRWRLRARRRRGADHAVRFADDYPGDAGAWRQVAEHLLCRCDGGG